MKKCEYKVETVSQGILFLPQFGIGNTPQEQEKAMNAAGKDGWKLVCVTRERRFFVFPQLRAYYVREKA